MYGTVTTSGREKAVHVLHYCWRASLGPPWALPRFVTDDPPCSVFVFLGFFDHQSFIGKTVEDITAHSARCQRGWVEELV